MNTRELTEEYSMERLAMEDVIEHCKRYTEKFERLALKYGRCNGKTELLKQYLEHKQVAEWLEELKRYRELEEQGKLIKVPFELGSTLYDIYEFSEFGEICDHPEIYTIDASRVEISKDKKGLLYIIDAAEYRENDFGTTLFNSMEEAEAAIAKIGSEV